MAGPQNPGCRVTINGLLPGGEIWATQFWLDDVLIGTQANLDDLASVCATALAGQEGLLLKTLSATSFLSGLTVRYYPAGSTAASLQSTPTFTQSAGTGTKNNPNQSCIVASLRSGVPGRRNRGRMYWPNTGGDLGADGLITAAMATNIGSGLANMFGAINNPGSTEGGWVSVLSRLTGAAQHVLNVQVDRRPDVQRRRANKISTPAPSNWSVTQPP